MTVGYNYVGVAVLLLSRGANVNLMNARGQKVIEIVVRYGCENVGAASRRI